MLLKHSSKIYKSRMFCNLGDEFLFKISIVKCAIAESCQSIAPQKFSDFSQASRHTYNSHNKIIDHTNHELHFMK